MKAIPSVFRKTLRDLRWQVVIYGFGLALFGGIIVALYPSYAAQLDEFEMPEGLKELFGMSDVYTTPEGFVSTEFFSQTVTLILTVFAIMQGTSAFAGEEANGTLDLLLASPISRARLAVEKIAGFIVSSVLISILILPGWLISIPAADVDLSIPKTALATFSFLPLVWAIYAMALLAASSLSSRRLATGVVVFYAVAAYIMYALALTIDLLEPLRWLSPYNYYNGSTVIADGPDLAKAAVLVISFVLCSALAVERFNRREIGVRGPEFDWRRLLRLGRAAA